MTDHETILHVADLLRDAVRFRHPADGKHVECDFTLPAEWCDLVEKVLRTSAQDVGMGWQPISTAPRNGTPFLAWCPIVVGLGDTDATPDAEIRVLWWESRGQFTSDRDLGNEDFTCWMPLPSSPTETPKDDPVNYRAWSKTLIDFVRERGLESDLMHYCGGWPCPVIGHGGKR